MRKHANVSAQFWTGATGKQIRKAGIEAQLLALYLVTSPHSNMLGIYYLPILYICHETGLSDARARKALDGLASLEFCEYDESTEHVWVREMVRYQLGEDLDADDNRVKGVKAMLKKLAKNPFTSKFVAKYAEMYHLGDVTCGTSSPFEAPSSHEEAPSKQLTGAGAVTGTGDSPARSERTSLQDRFNRFWDAYPKKLSKGGAEKAWKKIKPSEQLLTQMLSAIAAAKTSDDWQKDGGQFIPYPASWLNSKRWEDEITKGGAPPQIDRRCAHRNHRGERCEADHPHTSGFMDKFYCTTHDPRMRESAPIERILQGAA